MHGNAKSEAELRMALECGIGLIVIDNFDEIDRLSDHRFFPAGACAGWPGRTCAARDIAACGAVFPKMCS